MKKSRIRIFRNSKQIKAAIVPTLGKGTIRGISALGTEALTNTIAKAIGKSKSPKLAQAVSPGLALIGLVGEMVSENQYASSVFQGMSSESFRQIGHDHIPVKIKTKMNLAGLAADFRNSQRKSITQEDITNANNEMIAEEIRQRGKGKNSSGTSGAALNGKIRAK